MVTEKNGEIAYYKGKPIAGMNREELLKVLNEMANYYKSRLDEIYKIIDFWLGE